MKRLLIMLAVLLLLFMPVACRRKLAVAPGSPSSPAPASTPTVACLSPVPTATPTAVFFFDDFSTDRGWTYGSEWQRGPATASTGNSYGNPDPGQDHTDSADNQLAGAIIGGNTTTDLHDFFYLTSPAFDATGLASLHLSFWRWYNSDYADYAEGAVEVWDGVSWITLYSTGGYPGVTDPSWAFQIFDLTPYLNGALQVRFGHRVGQNNAFMTSGWNLDDVMLSADPPPTPVPTITFTVTDTFTPTPTPSPTSTGYCGSDASTCTSTDTYTETFTPTVTDTPTLTPTCIHPVGILGDGLIPDHTPDAGTPIVFGTPVLVADQAACNAYLPGNAFCSSLDFGLESLILTRSVELCYSTWLITWVEENCLGGLTVHATCNTGCYCCDPPDEYRYTRIPSTVLGINEIQCLPP